MTVANKTILQSPVGKMIPFSPMLEITVCDLKNIHCNYPPGLIAKNVLNFSGWNTLSVLKTIWGEK